MGARRSQSSSEGEVFVPGKFVLKKGPTGKFRFSLVSTNGQIVASSQAYETKRAAMGGVASVQKLAVGAKIVDTTVAAAAPAKAARKAAAKKPAAKPAAKKPPAKPAAKKTAAKPVARKSGSRKPASRR
jgi:uncharacterized protein